MIQVAPLFRLDGYALLRIGAGDCLWILQNLRNAKDDDERQAPSSDLFEEQAASGIIIALLSPHCVTLLVDVRPSRN